MVRNISMRLFGIVLGALLTATLPKVGQAKNSLQLPFHSVYHSTSEYPISASLSAYRYSCSYYSNTSADLKISFRASDLNVTADSQVFIHYGWSRGGADWQEIETQKMGLKESAELAGPNSKDDSQESIFTVTLTKDLHHRSSSLAQIDGIDFVFMIRTASGTESWIKGSDTALGYFEAEWIDYRIDCSPGNGTPAPEFHLPVESHPS